LLEALFTTDSINNKRNTDAVDLGQSQLASARIVKHTPSRTPPLADVKDRVRESVVQQQAAALARKDGEAMAAKVRQSADAALPAAVVVSRNQPQNLPREALLAVLQADASKLPLGLGVDLGSQGYLVARLTKVLPPEDAGAAASSLAAQYTQAWGNAETAAYYESLKRRHGVKVTAAAQAASAPAR
jgi:peptidyl-prolyl cis-trans isomerase D